MMKKGFLFLTVLKKRRLSTTAHTLNSVGSGAATAVRLKQHPVRLRLASGIIQWWMHWSRTLSSSELVSFAALNPSGTFLPVGCYIQSSGSSSTYYLENTKPPIPGLRSAFLIG